jgi:hypothetical protein
MIRANAGSSTAGTLRQRADNSFRSAMPMRGCYDWESGLKGDACPSYRKFRQLWTPCSQRL